MLSISCWLKNLTCADCSKKNTKHNTADAYPVSISGASVVAASANTLEPEEEEAVEVAVVETANKVDLEAAKVDLEATKKEESIQSADAIVEHEEEEVGKEEKENLLELAEQQSAKSFYKVLPEHPTTHASTPSSLTTDSRVTTPTALGRHHESRRCNGISGIAEEDYDGNSKDYYDDNSQDRDDEEVYNDNEEGSGGVNNSDCQCMYPGCTKKCFGPCTSGHCKDQYDDEGKMEWVLFCVEHYAEEAHEGTTFTLTLMSNNVSMIAC